MNTGENKSIVTRYNKEVIQDCNIEALKTIVTPNFVNHSGAPGMPEGVDSLIYFFSSVLHRAFSDIHVEIKDMIAEGDKVTTRKEITGKHTGELFGISPTGKEIVLKVIDILGIQNGQISDHWGENNFVSVLQGLQA